MPRMSATSSWPSPARPKSRRGTRRSPADAEGTLEDVTVIPRQALEKSEVVRSPLLPFDVELVHYFANARLGKVEPGDDNLATAGAGLHWAPIEMRAAAGTDMSQTVDHAAAYVKLIDKEKKSPIGTYLVGQELLPQAVEVGGKKYEITLRFPRYYKPYTVELHRRAAEQLHRHRHAPRLFVGGADRRSRRTRSTARCGSG